MLTSGNIYWIQNIEGKPNHKFLSFDIVEFYPSITEDLLDRAIIWARSFTAIPEEDISINKHSRKSHLLNGGTAWTKRSSDSLFVVTMGSFEEAEICELVCLFVSVSLQTSLVKKILGYTCDDGLALILGVNGRKTHKARKMLHDIFGQIGLKITAQVNNKVVNILDITLYLENEKFAQYTESRTTNHITLPADQTMHPQSILSQIPIPINKRISSLPFHLPFHQIFNRNTIKVSYSCMPNACKERYISPQQSHLVKIHNNSTKIR
jgi:hypothetical protein